MEPSRQFFPRSVNQPSSRSANVTRQLNERGLRYVGPGLLARLHVFRVDYPFFGFRFKNGFVFLPVNTGEIRQKK